MGPGADGWRYRLDVERLRDDKGCACRGGAAIGRVAAAAARARAPRRGAARATGNGPDTPVVTSSPRLPPPPPPQRRTTPPRASDSDPRTETPAAATAIGPNLPTEATRELRAVPSAAEPVPEQKAVQDQLERVKAELGKIVPSTLSSGDKRKFEDAKKFAAQASEKLKERNVLNAAQSVAKASQLLQDLSRR